MIDDDAIKKARELMRMMDSPAMKEMRRVIEDHGKALGGMELAILKEASDRADYLKSFAGVSIVSEQMSKAIFDLGRASRDYSDSIFGAEAMRQLSASEAMGRRLAEAINPASSSIEEFVRRQTEQTVNLSEMLKSHDWSDQIRNLAKTVHGFDLSSFQARFEPLSRMVTQAEASMRLLQWEKYAILDVQPLIRQNLEFRTEQLNRSFAGFVDRMILHPETIVSAPPFVAKMPPLAVYSHAEGIRALSLVAEEEQEERKDDGSPDRILWNDAREETLTAIEDMLPRISNDLLVSWKGGWHTAQKKSPDWVRQAAASFRYVLITVLDTAAPHSRVKNEVKPEYLNHKGEVVRKTQVVWLCEPLQNKTHRKVVLADLESTISIIDAFSEAVHRSQYSELEASFDRIAVRVAVTLQHILELYFSNGLKKP